MTFCFTLSPYLVPFIPPQSSVIAFMPSISSPRFASPRMPSMIGSLLNTGLLARSFLKLAPWKLDRADITGLAHAVRGIDLVRIGVMPGIIDAVDALEPLVIMRKGYLIAVQTVVDVVFLKHCGNLFRCRKGVR